MSRSPISILQMVESDVWPGSDGWRTTCPRNPVEDTMVLWSLKGLGMLMLLSRSMHNWFVMVCNAQLPGASALKVCNPKQRPAALLKCVKGTKS